MVFICTIFEFQILRNTTFPLNSKGYSGVFKKDTMNLDNCTKHYVRVLVWIWNFRKRKWPEIKIENSLFWDKMHYSNFWILLWLIEYWGIPWLWNTFCIQVYMQEIIKVGHFIQYLFKSFFRSGFYFYAFRPHVPYSMNLDKSLFFFRIGITKSINGYTVITKIWNCQIFTWGGMESF